MQELQRCHKAITAIARSVSESRSTAAIRAFTLIELLVVVAIIAVLISILLPSLGSARKLANRVVCGTHLKQLGIAGAGYSAEENDWIVGAPNGSGLAAFGPGSFTTYRDPPTTVWDWINPMRRRYLGDTNVNLHDVLGRMSESREGLFRCREVREVMKPFAGGPVTSPFTIQTVPSYLTLYKMLSVGESYRSGSSPTQGRPQPVQVYNSAGGPVTPNWQVYYSSWEAKAPSAYLPKLNLVGPAARKIFVMEGTRYVTEGPDAHVDYDINRRELGSGSYAGAGPTFNDSPEWGPLRPLALKLSYRHSASGQRGLNALFFDGHVELLSEKQSRYHGYTLPSGCTLNQTSGLPPETLEALEGYSPGDLLPD